MFNICKIDANCIVIYHFDIYVMIACNLLDWSALPG